MKEGFVIIKSKRARHKALYGKIGEVFGYRDHGNGRTIYGVSHNGNDYDFFDHEIITVDSNFVSDFEKMRDFEILTKDEFLDSYRYLTEDEYDATELYLNWLREKGNRLFQRS